MCWIVRRENSIAPFHNPVITSMDAEYLRVIVRDEVAFI